MSQNNIDGTKKLFQLRSWEARYVFSWPLQWKDTSVTSSVVHIFLSLSSNFLMKSLSVGNHNISWNASWIWDGTRASETLNLQLKVRSRREKNMLGMEQNVEKFKFWGKRKKNARFYRLLKHQITIRILQLSNLKYLSLKHT